MRGEIEEKVVQKAMRMGIVVHVATNIVKSIPPPRVEEMSNGIEIRRRKRRLLDQESLPGPSAGNGAFLIAGDCGCVS